MINRVARGENVKRSVLHMLEENYDFSDHKGTLSFSEDMIEMAFDCDEVREGSFWIENQSDTPVKGYILSNNMRMKCEPVSFMGERIEIKYTFDSVGMEAGDVVKGDFQIVTNKGEYILSFKAGMEQGYLYSSMGHIRNLFHFANLAKTNWEEAVALYYSNRFTELLVGSDASFRTLYRGLSRDAGNEQCVDEFLVAVKKKDRVHYSTSSGSISLGEVRGEMVKELELSKTGWGNVKGRITTDAPFIRLHKEEFVGADFAEDVCRIPFSVANQDLCRGRNYGKIVIETMEGNIEVNVTADCGYISEGKNEGLRYKRQVAELLHFYLEYRLGRMKKEEWIQKSDNIVKKISGDDERVTVARLYQAQLLLAAERDGDAAFILEHIEEEMGQQKQYPEVYGYFLYLTSLLNREEEYTNKVAAKVKKLYHRERENVGLSWLMLQLREDLFYYPEKKWEYLQDCYRLGINSPLLYIEALGLLKENPSLLAKPEDFELEVLLFARKHKALTAGIAERMQLMVSRKKNFDRTLYQILVSCYECAPSKELLQTICSFLMSGSCIGEEYFHWYELAVQGELKLTRLYEYFVQSISLNDMRELPLIVMMYFAYQNNLDYERMAYLHVNVLKHKDKFPEIAASYGERLPDFVKEQIRYGRISEHLVYLYKEVIGQLEMDVAFANEYAPMLFMNEVKADGQKYRSVVVIHDNFLGECEGCIKDDRAYVPVYGQKYYLLLTDNKNNRFVLNNPEVKPVLFSETLYRTMVPMVQEQSNFLLHHCEDGRMYVNVTKDNVFGYALLLQSEDTTFTFKREILVELVKYYFENDCIRELDELIFEVKPEILSGVERGELIHILVARGMYEMAFEWVCTFGVEHVEIKTILRLCSRLLEKECEFEEEDMLDLSAYLYRKNKYDPNILNYLQKHFNGGIRESRALLRACESFSLDVFELLERLLVQTLFTGVFLAEKMNLYDMYRKNGGNYEIEKAFLARCAYDYFVKEVITDDIVFERLEEMLEDGEALNRVSRFAYLKHASEQARENWNVPLISSLISKELKRDTIFSFFAVFAQEIPALLPFTDRVFVEYRGESSSRVIMHYAIEHENGVDTEYRKEEMPNVFAGIFVKSFILFYGESIQYYITEQNGNREQLTQSSVLERNEETLQGTEWRYSILNDAAIARDVKDYKTCEESLWEYMKKECLVQELFKY